MKSKIAFTKKDIAVALVCLVFLLMSLGAVGSGGRERAKRAVCLSNLKQLSLAWHQYADDNDGRIVNGAPVVKGDRWGYADPPTRTMIGYGYHKNEKPWIGAARSGRAGEQLHAIKGGAMWPYTKNANLYRCPAGRRGELITCEIMDAMNGLGLDGSRGNARNAGPGVWIKKMSEIHDPPPAARMVFIDEGFKGADSYAVMYSDEAWFDSPPWRHGGGVCLSYADGHSDYTRWKGQWTLTFAKVCASAKTSHQTAFKRPGEEIDMTPDTAIDDNFKYVPATCDDFEDLYFIQKGCWSKLGYVPTCDGL